MKINNNCTTSSLILLVQIIRPIQVTSFLSAHRSYTNTQKLTHSHTHQKNIVHKMSSSHSSISNTSTTSSALPTTVNTTTIPATGATVAPAIEPSSPSSSIIKVERAGFHPVNGYYHPRPSTIIPVGFDRTCRTMNWDTQHMWNTLSDSNCMWYSHVGDTDVDAGTSAGNDSYIYYNTSDDHWWMDGPSGAGIYIVKSTNGHGRDGERNHVPTEGWKSLNGDFDPVPQVSIVTKKDNEDAGDKGQEK